jgi:hypothetical protein
VLFVESPELTNYTLSASGGKKLCRQKSERLF